MEPIELASFEGSKFRQRVRFSEAIFGSGINFQNCDFEDATIFDGISVSGDGKFSGFHAKRAFEFSGVVFRDAVPDFTQADFVQPPNFDSVSVPIPRGVSKGTGIERKLATYLLSTEDFRSRFAKALTRPLSTFKRFRKHHIWWIKRKRSNRFRFLKSVDREDIRKFRALRRLAVQAHDHENELLFLKGEQRARRAADPEFGFWKKHLSAAYDFISDYGRSIWRPITGLAGFLVIGGILNYLFMPEGCACTGGNAFLISLKNALPVIISNNRQEVMEAYECFRTAGGAIDVPGWITFFGIVQTLFSVAMIFFFLLALRNTFRIK